MFAPLKSSHLKANEWNARSRSFLSVWEAVSWRVSDPGIWVDHLVYRVTDSLGGNVKIQTSPFKVRFWCPERLRDLTVGRSTQSSSLHALSELYCLPVSFPSPLGSRQRSPTSSGMRYTWLSLPSGFRRNLGGGSGRSNTLKKSRNPQQMTDRKLAEKYPRFLAPWWKDSRCLLPSLWQTPARLQPFPIWWPTY